MRSVLFLVAAVACLCVTARGQILLQDNFNDNVLNTALWNVVTVGIPQGSANVLEQNQRAELINRGHLVTVGQFDPNQPGEIRVTGKWTFVSGADFMQVLTRSDGVPSGSYGETQHGLEFQITVGASRAAIRTRSTLITVGQPTTSGNITIQVGQTYEFEIIDTGSVATLTLWTPGRTSFETVTIPVLSDTTTRKHVVFHNREVAGGAHFAHLDDVVIRKGPTQPAGIWAYGNSSPGCTGPLTMSATSVPSLGNAAFSLACDNAPPSSGGGVITGAKGLVPPISPIVVLGVDLLVDPTGAFLVIGYALSNQAGLADFKLPIPQDPALTGAQLYAQFVWIGQNAPAPCPPTGLSTSHALRITVR